MQGSSRSSHLWTSFPTNFKQHSSELCLLPSNAQILVQLKQNYLHLIFFYERAFLFKFSSDIYVWWNRKAIRMHTRMPTRSLIYLMIKFSVYLPKMIHWMNWTNCHLSRLTRPVYRLDWNYRVMSFSAGSKYIYVWVIFSWLMTENNHEAIV